MLVTFPWNQKKMFMLLSGGRGNNHICCVMKKTTMNWTKRMTISTKIIQTGLLKNIINNNQQTIIPYHYSCCSGCMHIQIRSLDKQIWLVVSYMSNSVTCQTGECWRVKKLCGKIPIPIYYCVYKKLFRPSEKHFLCPFQVKEPMISLSFQLNQCKFVSNKCLILGLDSTLTLCITDLSLIASLFSASFSHSFLPSSTKFLTFMRKR